MPGPWLNGQATSAIQAQKASYKTLGLNTHKRLILQYGSTSIGLYTVIKGKYSYSITNALSPPYFLCCLDCIDTVL